MKKRPSFVVLLAILLICEPIIKILLFKANYGFEWSRIFQNIASIEGVKNLFNFWLLFPLSGLAILLYKKWSYIIFLMLQAYSLYTHLFYESYTWPYISKEPSVHAYIMVGISLFLAVYFILPDVRKPYFFKNMRWWEQAIRYKTNLRCLVHFQGNLQHETSILNISRTGCFVKGLDGVELSSLVKISIPETSNRILVPSKVVSHHQFEGVRGAGLQFVFDGQESEKNIKKLISKMKRAAKFAR